MNLLACALLAATAACQQDAKTSQFATSAGAGDLSARVKKLEDDAAKNADAMKFLNDAYAQQKQQRDAQQAEQERSTAAPDAVFAISIAANSADGPASAPVTLVEAWDFA